ncbi:MAG: hypothetical protein ABI273_21810 [Lacunisphaera sp.]
MGTRAVLLVWETANRMVERHRAGAASNRFQIAGEYHLAEVVCGPKLDGQVFDRQKIQEQFNVTSFAVNQPDGDPVRVHKPVAAGDALPVSGSRNELKKFARDHGVHY